MKMLGRFLRDAVIIVVAALVVSFLIKTFLIRSFFIPTESMEATLIRDDRIIVSQLPRKFLSSTAETSLCLLTPGGGFPSSPV